MHINKRTKPPASKDLEDNTRGLKANEGILFICRYPALRILSRKKNMKTTLTCILVFVLAVSCNIRKKPTTDEAVTFNDKVIDMMDPYYSAADEFGYALLDDSVNSEITFNKLQETVEGIIKQMNALPSFDDEDELKKAAIAYMEAIQKVNETEYKKMISIKADPNYQDMDSDKYQQLFDSYWSANDRADKALTAASEEFDVKQRSFAKKYKFDIIG